MTRPWIIWTVFVVFIVLLLAPMGWLSLKALSLEEAQEESRRRDRLEEAVRLALWRLDSTLGDLVDAREQQREDWIAWSLFWLLASGVDAFVNAHLADFPAAIELEPAQDRSLSVSLQIPLPLKLR